MNIAIVGRGRVGNALRRSLEHNGVHDVAVMGRKPNLSAVRNANLVILAVSDDAIQSVAERIATELKPGATVLHCAGARGVDELEACAARGANVGVMHPLVSFPSTRRHPNLESKTFVVNGSPRAIAMSRRIGKACGARVIVAETADPIYHAAAALVANGAALVGFRRGRPARTLGSGKSRRGAIGRWLARERRRKRAEPGGPRRPDRTRRPRRFNYGGPPPTSPSQGRPSGSIRVRCFAPSHTAKRRSRRSTSTPSQRNPTDR